MKIRNLFVLAAMAASPGVSLAQSLSITGVISETVGSTAALTGGGTKENTTTFATGTAGVFSMSDGVTTSYMRVSTSNPTGALVIGRDALMVARTDGTVGSQGLKDTGTLSIYVRPATAANTEEFPTGRWSLDTRFEFFSDIGLTTPATTNLLLTSLDIDFGQRYYTDNSDFSSNVTYGTPGSPTQVTTLTGPDAIAGYTGFTSTGNGTFNDERFAVGSAGNKSTFDIKLSHDSVALFMFEFRNPSQVIPEPSSAILMTAGLSMLCLHRRRRVA
jgi:hypothetical protein